MTATPRAVDFTNVTDGGNFAPRRVPAGDYRAKIVSVADHASGDSKVANNWVFGIALTSRSRNTYPYYCGFDVKQAWKVRGLCLAAGINVPKKRMKVDPNKLVGKEIGVSLDDDEYEGKEKSNIVGVFPASELAEDYPGAGTTSASAKSSAKRSAKAADTDDDDTDGDADDVDVADGDDEDLDLDEI